MNPFPDYKVSGRVPLLEDETDANQTEPKRWIQGNTNLVLGFATLKCTTAVDVYLVTYDEVLGETAVGGKVFSAPEAGTFSLAFPTGPQTWGLVIKNNTGTVNLTGFPSAKMAL